MTKVPEHRPSPSSHPKPSEDILDKKGSKEFKIPDKETKFPQKDEKKSIDLDKDKKSDKKAVPDELGKKKLPEEKKKEEKEDKKKDDQEEKPVFIPPSSEFKIKSQEVQEIKKSGLSPIEAKKSIEQIREVILRMADSLKTGSVEGKTVHQVDLKKTAEVPSFLQGASVMVTQEAPGKISISIGNLNDANLNMTIRAIESQKTQLEQLLRDLEVRQISIAELKVGDHIVALPPIVAPPISLTAGDAGFEGSREGGQDQGTGGGGGGQGGGREGGEGRRERGERQ